MAADPHDAYGFDMKQHEQTWNAFMKLLQWSVVAIAITLALMAYFLT